MLRRSPPDGSYVYDQETSLYYLQSRYYNPEIGRFINADALVSTGQGFLGNNMFAYCLNNPVNGADINGKSSDSYAGWIGELVGAFIYELITGDDHPSRQTEEIEQIVVREQTKMVFKEVISFVESEDFPKAQATTKMVMGAKDIAVGVTTLFAPDPTPINELAAVRRATWGIIRFTWGLGQLIGEVICK